ncbi:MAG: pilus assembly protein [Alphaproteobacteria bacterium]|nr:pilus assembly protein [Alphaproteobacteria bacterium]
MPNQRGATAVEMAFILPVALLLVLGTIQFGGLLYLQHTMTSVVKDVVRRVAVGDLSAIQGRQMIEDQLADWPATFAVTVDTSIPDEIEASISVPRSDAAFINIGYFLDGNLTAQATMRRE